MGLGDGRQGIGPRADPRFQAAAIGVGQGAARLTRQPAHNIDSAAAQLGGSFQVNAAD